MDEHTLSVISLTIGIASFVSAILFFLLGLRTERKNREILDAINAAIQGWQSAIMSANIELIESQPEIVAKREGLEETRTKNEFINSLSERIKYLVENPLSQEEWTIQTSMLQMLLTAFQEATKSKLPPELVAEMVKKEIKVQYDKPTKNP